MKIFQRQKTKTIKEDYLIGYWNFNENEGDVLYDLSGNGNYGIIKEVARFRALRTLWLSKEVELEGDTEDFISYRQASFAIVKLGQ